MFLLAVVVLFGACQPIEQAPPPTHAHGAGTETKADPVPSATNESKDAHTDGTHAPPAGAIAPRATVEQVEAGQEALAQAIVAASTPTLAECRANAGGGTIRLRVVSTKTSAKITVDPSSTVNADTRHCVLEALSTLDVPDTLSQASPSMKPTAGFTSIIAVNW